MISTPGKCVNLLCTLTISPASNSSNTRLKTDIKRSRVIFDKYYKKTEESPHYAAAIILHPSRKYDIFKEIGKETYRSRSKRRKEALESYRELDALDLSTGPMK